MEVDLNEQDVIDAVILFIADREDVHPSRVRVELLFDEKEGFSARAVVE